MSFNDMSVPDRFDYGKSKGKSEKKPTIGEMAEEIYEDLKHIRSIMSQVDECPRNVVDITRITHDNDGIRVVEYVKEIPFESLKRIAVIFKKNFNCDVSICFDEKGNHFIRIVR